jgi:two-component system KDP operon response regulator KdpE
VAGSQAGSPFRTGDLEVDLTRRTVRVRGVPVRLTPTQYDVLKVLIRSAGRVLTHQQLLRRVWGPGYTADSHLLRVNISTLRRKLEVDPEQPRHILTEPRIGYRLNIDDQADRSAKVHT